MRYSVNSDSKIILSNTNQNRPSKIDIEFIVVCCFLATSCNTNAYIVFLLFIIILYYRKKLLYFPKIFALLIELNEYLSGEDFSRGPIRTNEKPNDDLKTNLNIRNKYSPQDNKNKDILYFLFQFSLIKSLE